MLTAIEKTQFVQNPTNCPRCGYGDIQGDAVEISLNKASQKVWCVECKEEWTCHYEMTSVAQP